MSLREAEREVWSELLAGRIAARCSIASDMRENLSIAPAQWSDLTWRRTGAPDTLWTFSSPVVRFGYVYVETREALNRWAENCDGQQINAVAPEDLQPGPVGRPRGQRELAKAEILRRAAAGENVGNVLQLAKATGFSRDTIKSAKKELLAEQQFPSIKNK